MKKKEEPVKKTFPLGALIIISICIGFCLLVISTFKTGVTIYNNIVTAFQYSEKSLGDLETEYQRRYALVGNLVAIVKEVKEFESELVGIEKEIYVKTAEAKASATKMDLSVPDGIKTRIKNENGLGNILTNALDKIMVLAQKFPEIKDPQLKDRNKTFESLETLRRELKDIEENILYARKSLNEYVRVYNQHISIFPANMIASNFGFKKLEFFNVIDEEAKKDVKVQF